MYTATQAGAFVSEDKGATWQPYHVLIAMRSGKEMDRVPHDYQVPYQPCSPPFPYPQCQ